MATSGVMARENFHLSEVSRIGTFMKRPRVDDSEAIGKTTAASVGHFSGPVPVVTEMGLPIRVLLVPPYLST